TGAGVVPRRPLSIHLPPPLSCRVPARIRPEMAGAGPYIWPRTPDPSPGLGAMALIDCIASGGVGTMPLPRWARAIRLAGSVDARPHALSDAIEVQQDGGVPARRPIAAGEPIGGCRYPSFPLDRSRMTPSGNVPPATASHGPGTAEAG